MAWDQLIEIMNKNKDQITGNKKGERQHRKTSIRFYRLAGLILFNHHFPQRFNLLHDFLGA
jgi:hypothetical protein